MIVKLILKTAVTQEHYEYIGLAGLYLYLLTYISGTCSGVCYVTVS